MAQDPACTRRLLLGHGFGAALLLPASGMARPRPPRAVPSRTLPLIVLDPGHGGKDPGAIGASGTYEKHVAFAAAGELARRLRGTGHYRVALTRENDVFIPLEDRVWVAQTQGAALFVSLHADAVADPSVRGVSVYTLGSAGPDAQTAALAVHQNGVDHPGISVSPQLSPQISPHVADILASLVRHETRVCSAHAQTTLIASLGRFVPLLDNPARRAEFAVLKAPDIPSVLIEMGFMSNPQDEAALQKPGHRAVLASAIHHAIDGYFAAGAQLTRTG